MKKKGTIIDSGEVVPYLISEGCAWKCDDCVRNIKCKCYPNNNCEKCLYKKCTTKDKDTVD